MAWRPARPHFAVFGDSPRRSERVASGSRLLRAAGGTTTLRCRRSSRSMPPRSCRPAAVDPVRHACTLAVGVRRTERTGARLRRHQRRRRACTITDRTAIHVCNTTGCASICSHCLVPVFDASDPLKRRPRATAAARALLACTRHARSAPCCAAQGCTGPDIAAMQRAQRRQRVNDSKMKQRGRPRERRTVTALSWRSLALAGAVHRCRRDTDDPLTILRSSPRQHESRGALRSRPDARCTMRAQRDARRYIANPGHGRTRVRFVHSFEE
jgi:hypothetical protein